VLIKRLALFAAQALSFEKADETKAGINQVMVTYEHQRPVYFKSSIGLTLTVKSQAFGLVLDHIAPQIYREDDFLADFLQINDAGLTFADYAGLDNYFRRQANRSAGLAQSTMKLIRSAMDLIFGFLGGELKTWLDNALAKDSG